MAVAVRDATMKRRIEVAEDAPLSRAVELLLSGTHRAIVVTDARRRPLALVTARDVLRTLEAKRHVPVEKLTLRDAAAAGGAP
jgi:CBS domain-containing protein